MPENITLLNLHALTHLDRDNGRQFPDDIFRCVFLNENVWIQNKISLKFVPEGLINYIPALAQIMSPGRRQAIIWNNDV